MKSIYARILILLLVFSVALVLLKFNSQKRRNVILVMIDTLRADHLGAYGYKRNTSPILDAFAKENLIALRAIAVAPWTPPSVASILTGFSVARHGHNPELRNNVAKQKGQILNPKLDTLAEILKRNGYQTAGVSPNPWITKEFNFHQGFNNFYFQLRSSTSATLRMARNALAGFSKKPKQPFFLYVHILDPHGPYKPKAKYLEMFPGSVEGTWPYDERVQGIVNRYDAEIRNVDTRLGEFFEHLKEQGLYEETEILIISDHGEQFRERGEIGHGKKLYMEEVHVPFLLKCKGKQGIIPDVTSNLDVTPTILDCLDIEPPHKFDGISILDSAALKDRSGIYSSVHRSFIQEAFTSNDGMRILRSKGRPQEGRTDWNLKGGFDLSKDPLERSPIFETDLIADLSGHLESMKNLILPEQAFEHESIAVSDEVLKRLETLGYIND